MSEISGIIALFVGISALMTLWRSARTPADNRGWIGVSLLILLVIAVAGWLAPTAVGWIAGGVWLLLAALPALALRRLDQLIAIGDFNAARRLARGLSILHPADGWPGLPEVVAALEIAESGAPDEALARLAATESARTGLGRTAVAYVYSLRADWAGLRDWIEGNLDSAAIGRDPSMIVTYLRVLGELGALDKLLATLATYERTLRQIRGTTLGFSYLFAFAFGGRLDVVDHLLAGPLSLLDETFRGAWRATAMQAAGEAVAADALLQSLRPAAQGETLALIERRLAAPVAVAGERLGETGQERLEKLAKSVLG